MLNEHAQAWVAALRSGEYQQGIGQLRRDALFCCLGVACDLYAKEHPDAQWDDDTFYLPGDSAESLLPAALLDWLDLRDSSGGYGNDNLAGLNDGYGYTFEQIADVIESEPEGLFKST